MQASERVKRAYAASVKSLEDAETLIKLGKVHLLTNNTAICFSQHSEHNRYILSHNGDYWECTCQGFRSHRTVCKHILAVEILKFTRYAPQIMYRESYPQRRWR